MKELEAREGYFLTQAQDVQDRTFITAIKGMNVNEADWREATIAEKEAYERMQEAAMQEQAVMDSLNDV